MEKIEFINPYKLFIGAFIPNWLLERKGISHGAKLCYAKLCQYAGKDGVCFPKQEKIANDIGIEERQTRTYLQELEDNNLIVSQRIGRGCANRYKFLHHQWMTDMKKTAVLERQKTAVLERQKTAVLERQKTAAPIERESFEENQLRESKDLNTIARLKTSFELFWKDYPKKRSKGDAEKVWLKIKPRESLAEEILQAVQRSKTSEDWKKDNGKYIPYPATWLNARGWEDVIQTGKETSQNARLAHLRKVFGGDTKPGGDIQGSTPQRTIA